VYPRVLDELLPSRHVTEQYANNTVEANHGRLKARLRPMRGLKRLCSVRVICTGHAFVQNLRRGHYELAIDLDPNQRIPAAFSEVALAQQCRSKHCGIEIALGSRGIANRFECEPPWRIFATLRCN
jgi:hypothetical protein